MPMVSIDELGIHVPSYDAYRDWLIWNFREIYGQDIYLEADSQDGQLIGIFSLALYNSAQACAMAYHSFAPGAAQGIGLSRLVKINGIRRRVSTLSSVDVRIVGQNATWIRNGIVEDRFGNRWTLPVNFMIPEDGEITVTAYAVRPGAIRLQLGDLSKIATPTRGWQTVENVANSVPGTPIETDYDLRIRQGYSTALPSRTVGEGILGGILSLPGVAKARHYENFENFWALPNQPAIATPEGVGIQPHSICVVVLGGDVQEIGDMIRLRKTPGTGVFGDVYVDTTYSMGGRAVMRFFRPTIVPLAIQLQLNVTPRYDADTTEHIRNSLMAFIGGFQIGDSLRVNRLFAPIEAADISSYAPTFDVAGMTLTTPSGTYTNMQVVPIIFNELLEIPDRNDIQVVLSTAP